MNILIVQNSVFPAFLYGGTERVHYYEGVSRGEFF